RLWAVHHTNGTLEHGFAESVCHVGAWLQVERKGRNAHLVEEPFIAVKPGRLHTLPFCGPIPVGGGCHGTRVGREAYIAAIPAMLLANELSNVPLARFSHLGRPGIAHVRIVSPDNHLCPRIL